MIWIKPFGVVAAQLGLMLCLVGVSSTAYAADDALRTDLESRYAAMKVAMAARDPAQIRALLTPDFISTDATGRSNTASDMIDEVRALKSDPNKSSQTTILSADLDGPEAHVEQRYVMDTVKTSAHGVRHKIELIALSSDVWIKSPDVWLMKRTVTKEMSYFLDGRLVVHEPK